MTDIDPTLRFSSRVDNYIRWRPGYPPQVINMLRKDTRLTPAAVVADVGSGTGILSELFLRNGNEVRGIEPNAEMRQAGEKLLRKYPKFCSVVGRAEATTLPDASVDYVVAGQAFHWFDPPRARTEFARILRPDGWIVLIGNVRRLASTPFLQAYEALLLRFAIDYQQVRHENVDAQALCALFIHGYQHHSFYNEQRFDFEGLKGRLLSSSYAPPAGHPDHQAMLNELARIFRDHETSNEVCVEYDTNVYFAPATA